MEKLTIEENVIKTITVKDQGWDEVALSKYSQTTNFFLNGNCLEEDFRLNSTFTHLIRSVNLFKF